MSIENSLERIAAALEDLAASMGQPVATSVVSEPAPAVAATPASAPAAAPVPAAPSAAPFNDTNGLIKYITESYQQLGPEKGMQIQGILQGLGFGNVSEVTADKFGELHMKVEALKA